VTADTYKQVITEQTELDYAALLALSAEFDAGEDGVRAGMRGDGTWIMIPW
jgi:hypothetical protein